MTTKVQPFKNEDVTIPPIIPTGSPSERKAAKRLWTIDALRGGAALSVVFYHVRDVVGIKDAGAVSGLLDAVSFLGQYGVWLFFVISGFCIHLRWASAFAEGVSSPPRFVEFWRRRFRRLYPPYFVALAAYVVLSLMAGQTLGSRAMTNISLHILLLQNLDPRALNAINGVFWTLAIEEQLYLLYFVFIRVRIRFGWLAALALGSGARVAWFAAAAFAHRVFGADIVVTQSAAAQWIVWILGALSVEAWFGLVRLPSGFRRGWPALALLIGAAAISYAYLYLLSPGLVRDLTWLMTDFVWGVACFTIVNWTVGLESTGPSRLGQWLATIGVFSYSLYLTHEVITHYVWRVWAAPAVFRQWGEVPVIVMVGVLVAGSIAFAWLFFQAFEKPFLSARRTLASVRT